MKHIYVRPAREGDAKLIGLWSNGQHIRGFDPRIWSYQGSFTLCAFSGSDIIAFMPVQSPLFMETILFHPLANDLQKALAMKELTHAVITQAAALGKGEIYFLGNIKGTNEFAVRQAFKPMAWPLFRVVLADLEEKRNGHL